MDKWIDFRSDTVTRPTPAMRQAMAEAEVGDDVLREDPTVNRLEELAASMMGKDAALLVPSGTFGNQVALLTHCRRGDEVILSETSHIIQHEVGAAAVIAGVQLRAIQTRAGYPVWDEINSRIRWTDDLHYPKTGLIELENALSNGDVMPLDEMETIHCHTREKGIPIHLDGARIFNAAVYLGVTPDRIARYADSVMFCLSKGLCAPIGSILVGSAAFIERARKNRKLMGGGMRQAGILAAAGLIAIQTMSQRLNEDHQHAKRLAQALTDYPELDINPDQVKINMVFLRFKPQSQAEIDREFQLVESMRRHRILTYPPENGWIRLVTHHDITSQDMDRVIGLLPSILRNQPC
ncbi:MAG: low-specificity L-threonine aldolase [Candidatus Delongbacteria bacterium]|nr:low-specificity L-threonine aldolase [Candidatus Delongbacteria bacterium]